MIRVLYAGSPEASAKTFEILMEKAETCGFEIAGVLTNPPTAKGRHKELVSTAVGLAARKAGVTVFEPEHLDAAAREAVAAVQPDILVCFAYGHIFGPKFMGLFKFGGINLHPSALPEYRGCTPVNAAILGLNGKTAFTIQKVSEKMDEGNILAQLSVDLDMTETAESLLNDAAFRGAQLLCNVLKETSENGCIAEGRRQEGEESYTGIITKEMAKLDWKETPVVLDVNIRGYYSDPCAWTIEGENASSNGGTVLKILHGYGCDIEGRCVFSANGKLYGGAENPVPALSAFKDAVPGTVCHFEKSRGIFVKCSEGFVCVTELQRQGKNAMKYKDFMNGARNFIGTVLG